MKARILIGIASSLVCATALAAGGSQMGNNSMNSNSEGSMHTQLNKAHQRVFQKLDTNNDGVISREEAKRDPGLADHFSQVDHNKDRKIEKGEFSAFELTPPKDNK